MQDRIFLYLIAALLLVACSETKYVPEDKYLLDRVRVVSDSPDEAVSTSGLRALVRQQGNSRWFSAWKLPLATYSLSGRDTTKWVNRLLRSIGEPPQLYDSLQTAQTMLTLQSQLRNMGYLRATVGVDNRVKGRKMTTTYLLHPGQGYRLRRIDYDIQDTAICTILNGDDSWHQLQRGMAFNVDLLDAERTRITQLLTNRGYYRFNKDYITYRADSVAGSNEIDITLVLRDAHDAHGKRVPHTVYTMGSINYRSGNMADSAIHLRPRVLQHNTFIEPGKEYSSQALQATYNHFARLGVVRYTNISFRERKDKPVLDCDIQVSTNKPSTISFQPEGTNSAGDLGAAATLTYQNRNLFRGSELLSIELRGAYEAIRGLEGYAQHNFLEYSLGARLSFPRFIVPFLSSDFRRRADASSEVSISYDLQNRPEFHRRVFSVGWKYRWGFTGHHDRYQVDVVDLNYISMPWISDTFRKEYLTNTKSRNSILRYNYENLFIMKTGFGYSYNNGRYALKANVETAGNLLQLAAVTLGFHKNDQGQYTFTRLAYAQYARGTFDFSRYIQLDPANQLVFHVDVGIAYPYGNSRILPFEKRFFSGGANSVRGWSVRSLGPGSFIGTDGRIDFINQTGDLKLDINLEYRTHLFWKFNGALFVDAGNIWTIREYSEQPGGQFRLSEFWKEMAVGYGLGIRLNFDFFIVRFDMGMKAINPAYKGTRDQFPIVRPKLSRDFAFHFAVGMPF